MTVLTNNVANKKQKHAKRKRTKTNPVRYTVTLVEKRNDRQQS